MVIDVPTPHIVKNPNHSSREHFSSTLSSSSNDTLAASHDILSRILERPLSSSSRNCDRRRRRHAFHRPQANLQQQSHHMSMRHSPPFQPGEQRPSNTLPSFSQVSFSKLFVQATPNIFKLLQNVREPSPPRTPSRRDGSMESSPASRTHFDDVAWSAEGKRRRNDTLGDIHRPSNVSDYSSSAYDSRRTSAADSLSGPVQQPNYPSAPSHHHRPSLPYSAPPQAAMGGHVRHHSTSGVHQAAPQYTHHQRPSVVAANSYHQPSGHPYDQHHGNYYPETHGNPYFGQPQYANVPHPGYEGAVAYHSQVPQYNYTFQAALNADQNSFNRRRRGNLPKEATALLKDWFAAHRESPYPTEDEKLELCRQTQLTLNQVCLASFFPLSS